MKNMKVMVIAVLALALNACTTVADEWISLFDGETLEGWTANESPDSWKIEEGTIVTAGVRSHLFYSGDVMEHNFNNFEFSVDVNFDDRCDLAPQFENTSAPPSGKVILVRPDGLVEWIEENAEMAELLFVQNAHDVTLEKGKLTLQKISPTTIFFTDRPKRIAGHMTTKDFVAEWGAGDNSFAADPPNAGRSVPPSIGWIPNSSIEPIKTTARAWYFFIFNLSRKWRVDFLSVTQKGE